jgi:NADH:ubiquinone reductase (H+-translocating)
LRGHKDIFVIGDTASVPGPDGQPLPGVAPVAMQQGRYVASVILDRLRGDWSVSEFKYRDKGNLATIGRSSAVAAMGNMKLSGWLAWMAWLVVHIYYLIGFRNRVMVILEWAWAYLTFQRGARIIVEPPTK